ncbi:LOW QUALITY PROTEIN: hypothetical protein OSB04_030929 [Centaurea solstitialis]|uniref:Reverse transcriptase domain-containing protein n=1 Tax=Centaurea solstitialis TaxID=347529 RepID=A0AA38SKR6_9ASTR|nr:LOW QUALITY PROTEIN: hypothetical protein OSB04_030929 [Centaurea solstitialis]
MKEAKEKGIFEGTRIGNEDLLLIHLQYVDDAIFFGKWSVLNLKNLIKILKFFQEALGLKIYIGKNKFFRMRSNLGEGDWVVLVASCHLYILGLQVGRPMNKIGRWKEVIAKVKNKVGSWKTKLISIGGRFTLVASVLGSILLYLFLLFRAPRGVIHELKSVKSNFYKVAGKGSELEKWLTWVKNIIRIGKELEKVSINFETSFGMGEEMRQTFDWIDGWVMPFESSPGKLFKVECGDAKEVERHRENDVRKRDVRRGSFRFALGKLHTVIGSENEDADHGIQVGVGNTPWTWINIIRRISSIALFANVLDGFQCYRLLRLDLGVNILIDGYKIEEDDHVLYILMAIG